MNSKERAFLRIAKKLASEHPDFLKTRGPGKGNHWTNKFVSKLRKRVERNLRTDHSEQRICGDNGAKVDYYFPDEKLVVEVALGLNRPLSEFEKDIFKVLLAKESGCKINRLLFVTKPGGMKKCDQPFRKGVAQWLRKMHGITVEIVEL